MKDTRQANQTWCVTNANGQTASWDAAQLAVLMDLRDQLQELNRLLRRQDFLAIPSTLSAIRRNTVKPRQKKETKLQELNRLLRRPDFLAIPSTLSAIRRNTVKPRQKKETK